MIDCPSWKLLPDPVKSKLKANGQVVYRMDPENLGPCSVGAVVSGNLELLGVTGDGHISVRATKDGATGSIAVTKRCPIQIGEGPAECGPTTINFDVGKGTSGITLGEVLFVLFLGALGTGIGFAVGGPAGAALLGLGSALLGVTLVSGVLTK